GNYRVNFGKIHLDFGIFEKCSYQGSIVNISANPSYPKRWDKGSDPLSHHALTTNHQIHSGRSFSYTAGTSARKSRSWCRRNYPHTRGSISLDFLYDRDKFHSGPSYAAFYSRDI